LLGWGDDRGDILGVVRIAAGTDFIDIAGVSAASAGLGETVRLDFTRCTTGGTRPLLLCPRCHGRRAILYLDQTELRCRGCLTGTTYLSTTVSRRDRLQLHRQKAREALGMDEHGNAERPRYMHLDRWLRLWLEWRDAEMAVISDAMNRRL
jgi:hypothetical protein